MAVVNRISEQRVPGARRSASRTSLWELWDGVPREKPSMSMKHNDVAYLSRSRCSSDQLDRRVYRVTVNGDRARLSSRDYYIPDVVVIPTAT